jgi:hypothetical protein
MRRVILRTNHLPVFGAVYRSAWRQRSRSLVRRLLDLPIVETVYSRHSSTDAASFLPGHSDLDLTLVLREDAAEDAPSILGLEQNLDRLAAPYPLLNPTDVRFVTARELRDLERHHPGPVELLYAQADWLLLGGNDVRGEERGEMEGTRVIRHPEFPKWWRFHLQQHLLSSDGQDRFCRSLFRGALKNQLHLAVAAGHVPAKALAHVGNEIPARTFVEGSPLPDLLREVERRHFWVEDARESNVVICYWALREVAAHARQHLEVEDREAEGIAEDTGEHKALHSCLAKAGVLDLLEAVVTWPEPFRKEPALEVELVFDGDLPLERFRILVSAVRDLFPRRRCVVDGREYRPTLVPSPLHLQTGLRWASSLPFHAVHFQRHARTLLGKVPSPGSSSTDDHRSFLGQYLYPWHFFNFRRRIPAAARHGALAHLASMRAFLHDGTIATRAEEVLLAAEGLPGGGPPDPAVLLESGEGWERQDPALHARTFAWQARTYGDVARNLPRRSGKE